MNRQKASAYNQSVRKINAYTNRKFTVQRCLLPVACCSLLFAIAACSTTKHIPDNDALYTGATVKLNAENVTKQQKKLYAADLQGLTRPRPNGSLLGIPFKLILWNLFYTTKPKSFKGKLQSKLGQPPVLASSVKLSANTSLIQNHLQNKGFFNTQVTADSTWKKKKAHVTYTANAGPQYKIKGVEFRGDSSQLGAALQVVSKGTLLKIGAPYDLDLIKGERLRIDGLLKERGFYYFNPDNLLVLVDSNAGPSQVNMRVVIKPDTPKEAKDIYTINDVFIYDNYSLNSARGDTAHRTGGRRNASRRDTGTNPEVVYQGYHIVDPKGKFKPKLFPPVMRFAPGDVYNRTDHNKTLQRLIDLNVFKFVKNRFERVPSDSAKLNAYYYLTPFPEKALRAEIGANTKSNNLNGSEISLGFKHRNTFRAAEQMDLRVYGGTEAQFSGSFSGTSTFRVGGELNFAIPRFVTPFFTIKNKSSFIPRTNLQLGYEALNRKTLYTLNSFHGGLGYIWKSKTTTSHEFYPIAITYVKPLNVSEIYKAAIIQNPTLQHITDTQFILGSTYQYNYNQQAAGAVKTNSFYFNGLVDVAGNLAGLFTKGSGSNGKRILNSAFSQYVKLELDGRYYRKVGANSTWANRLIVGFAAPYGNSRELPYIKQFFIGGNNSLRGFRSRTVGPGTYKAVMTSQGFIPDQTGDVKLEINSELRPRISGPIYGAVFVEGGNIWLQNVNGDKPGATIDKDFLSEIAMDAGLGLRIDIQLFVLRLDLAFPLRDPARPVGQRDLINQINFGSQAWRRENLVFNLAIGYPF